MKKHLFLVIAATVFAVVLIGCNESISHAPVIEGGDYTLNVKYDSIRSYPTGGGIFVVWISPQSDFAGDVELSVEANPMLNAVLSKTKLRKGDTVAEVLIKPDKNIDCEPYDIKIKAVHAGAEKQKNMKAVLYYWGLYSGYENAYSRRDDFENWIKSQKPEYGEIFSIADKVYHTYPEVLIVEHFTFIDSEYEVRICYHVMVPPHDWSYICVRKRSRPQPVFAAKRESNGSIKEIPVSEYPTLFGY